MENWRKCCVHFWRFLFIALNVAFLLIGLALIGLGIYLLATQNDLRFLTDNNIASGGALILVSGIITAIISFLGILGAAGMWPIILGFYIALIALIIILEIAAGIVAFVFRNQLETVVEERALQAFSEYNDTATNSAVNQIVDFFQNRFDCCGYSSFSDWQNTSYFESTNMYPPSCVCDMTMAMENCISVSQTLSNDTTTDQDIWSQSCNDTITDFIEDNVIVIGVVGIVFALIEIFGLVLSIVLCICFCVIKRKSQDEYYNKPI